MATWQTQYKDRQATDRAQLAQRFGTSAPTANNPSATQPPITKPVLGRPIQAPVGDPADGQQGITQPVLERPTQANPYNLPSDLVQGMTQDQQFENLLGQFETARNETNAANEARYQDILGGYNQYAGDYAQRTNDLMGNMSEFGKAQEADLARKFEQQEAGLTQDMIDRGLYNSTSLDAARRGMSYDQSAQNLQLQDMLMRQKMDYQRGVTQEELQARLPGLQFKENRTDVGPEYSDIASIAAAVGQGQAKIPDYQSALGNYPAIPVANLPQLGVPSANVGQTPTYTPVNTTLPKTSTSTVAQSYALNNALQSAASQQAAAPGKVQKNTPGGAGGIGGSSGGGGSRSSASGGSIDRSSTGGATSYSTGQGTLANYSPSGLSSGPTSSGGAASGGFDLSKIGTETNSLESALRNIEGRNQGASQAGGGFMDYATGLLLGAPGAIGNAVGQLSGAVSNTANTATAASKAGLPTPDAVVYGDGMSAYSPSKGSQWRFYSADSKWHLV